MVVESCVALLVITSTPASSGGAVATARAGGRWGLLDDCLLLGESEYLRKGTTGKAGWGSSAHTALQVLLNPDLQPPTIIPVISPPPTALPVH